MGVIPRGTVRRCVVLYLVYNYAPQCIFLVLEQLPLSLHREFALILELDQQVSGAFLCLLA